MGREIKFRAWDKREKRWMSDSEFSSICIDLDGRVSKFSFAFETFDSIDGAELMQYTGLRDKNGTEIYEGDILKVPDWYDLPENTSMTYNNQVVDFKDGAFRMKGECVHDDHEYISEECEVIGNIYENADLLANTVSE